MLTTAQAILGYDFRQGTVHPDRLRRTTHRHYARAAESMIATYRRGEGQQRYRLHHRVDAILDRLGDCPPRRAAAFCKLLDDRCLYHTAAGTAAKLRKRVFGEAAPSHPLVERPQTLLEHAAADVRDRIATRLGRPWEAIEAELFADVIELQTMKRFDPGDDFSPLDLLSAYNLGQTQAALYRATTMTVWATEDLKTIARHAKLAGLMHRITRLEQPPPGFASAAGFDSSGDAARRVYRFEFDGAASILRQTWRYGVRFAKLLPTLVACRGWKLRAQVLGPAGGGRRDRPYTLELSPRDGLRSRQRPPQDYDSEWEREIAQRWERAAPEGWTLDRESELLFQGQTVLTPDFVLRRRDRPGQPIYVELVGYWTPEYLQEKSARLREFRRHRWIILAAPSARATIPEGLPVMEIRGKFDPQELLRVAEQWHP